MAQRQRPQANKQEQNISLSTSVQTVKDLLETGVGCISYLRGLFLEDNFIDHKLVAPRAPISPTNPPSGSAHLEDRKGTEQTVKVKKLKRGGSDEGDKLLDYVERGAADAIEKGYLHQLMLAIYFDPEDPTNIVECYTFTFSYQTDAEGNKHPELVVRNQMSGMVISGTATNALNKSRPVKVDDAKRQTQKMIKNLIVSTQALDELPRRRFITLRLYYTDDTPIDYEPPLFRPVDAQKSEFQISTSQVGEAPELETLGTLSTGFHGVTLHMVSIAPLLEVPFDDTISADECLARNRLDAATRSVVWDAEKLVLDEIKDDGAHEKTVEPVGVRDAEGVVRSVEEVERWEGMGELRRKVGLEEEEGMVFAKGVAKGVGSRGKVSDNEALRKAVSTTESTSSQPGPSTQVSPVISRAKSSRPPVPFFNESQEDYSQRYAAAASTSQGASFEDSYEKLETVEEDIEMADASLESLGSEVVQSRVQHQAAAQGFPRSSLNAFEIAEDETQLLESQFVQEPLKQEAPKSRNQSSKLMNIGARSTSSVTKAARGVWANSGGRSHFQGCECGDVEDDEAMIWCEGCQVWKHAVCYGFEDVNDPRLSDDPFFCYPCRVICGDAEALLDSDREVEIENALNDLRSLSLFRRAVATIWQEGVLNMAEFSTRLAVDASTAGQVIKRLCNEKFIVDKSVEQSGKKSRKTVKVSVVNKTIAQERIKDAMYFTPGRGAELGLTLVLDCTEDDADGEAEILSRQASARSQEDLPPAAATRSATSAIAVSRDAPQLERPATIKELLQVNPATSSKPRPPARISTSEEDDPIVNSDDEFAPAQVNSDDVDQSPAQSSVLAKKKAPFIPKISKGKGKGKEKASASSAFQRASSVQVNPFAQANAMDVDTYDEPATVIEPATILEPETIVEPETIQEEPTLASTAKLARPASRALAAKRPAANDEELGAGMKGRQEGRKRFKKASEARALEI